jgi:hypothetical protein
MPVIFKSKATGDLLMVSAHAQAVLDVLGKTASQAGILIPEDMPAALTALRSLPDEAPSDDERDEGSSGVGDVDGVSLRKRAWPMVKMIEEALAANASIVWGV